MRLPVGGTVPDGRAGGPLSVPLKREFYYNGISALVEAI